MKYYSLPSNITSLHKRCYFFQWLSFCATSFQSNCRASSSRFDGNAGKSRWGRRAKAGTRTSSDSWSWGRGHIERKDPNRGMRRLYGGYSYARFYTMWSPLCLYHLKTNWSDFLQIHGGFIKTNWNPFHLKMKVYLEFYWFDIWGEDCSETLVKAGKCPICQAPSTTCIRIYV